MTTRNAALAYAVLDHIDAHPESWDQTTWDCGSSACFAGWAVRLSGWKVSRKTPVSPITVVEGPENVVGMEIPDAAVTALGHRCCNEDWSDDLFGMDNTRERLGRLVEQFFGPRPEPAQ